MEEILIIIGTNLFISLLIYLIIAFTLIVIDTGKKESKTEQNNLTFDELLIDYSEIPEYSTYTPRDNSELHYRYYASQASKVLILIHGSGWHGNYFLPLANYLSSHNIAHVYTPDLRGHGMSPKNRGDISYINQLEDDLADFVQLVKQKNPSSTVIVGGHSSGGGLVTRFAGSTYKDEADAYLLLAPYLKYNAPTTRANSGGWARPHLPRIIGLSMLNNVGIRFLNHLRIIEFNLPEEYRNGTETLSYSYRLNVGYAPRNYRKELRKVNQDLLIVTGKSDEVLYANQFPSEIATYKPDASVKLIDNVSHMGVVVGKEAQPIIGEWISRLK